MEMIRRIFFVMVTLVVCMAAGAQSADKLYKEGKALYDAKPRRDTRRHSIAWDAAMTRVMA